MNTNVLCSLSSFTSFVKASLILFMFCSTISQRISASFITRVPAFSRIPTFGFIGTSFPKTTTVTKQYRNNMIRMSSKSISSASTMPIIQNDGDVDEVLFGKFIIPKSSIFYQSSFNSYAFVNLRPIVPGHVLVIPRRITEKMEHLNDTEYSDLWNTVRVVQRILQAQYPNCEGFNVAVQDGKAAGQSVSHVHVHILPRCMGDYERNDDVYNDLEEWAPRDTTLKQNSTALNVPDDNQRRDRTVDEMSEEAEQYRIIVDKLLSNTSSLH